MDAATLAALVGLMGAAAVNIGGSLIAWGALRSTVSALAGRIAALESEMKALGELKLDVARLQTRLDAVIEQLKDLNASLRWGRESSERRTAARARSLPTGT
jgi:uncharacterized coiled-coil protein SlyX